MRINLNVPREISTERTLTSSASTQSTDKASPQPDQFSTDTVSLHSIAARALELPEIRQDKVDSVRQKIASGEYQVDAHKTAAALLKD